MVSRGKYISPNWAEVLAFGLDTATDRTLMVWFDDSDPAIELSRQLNYGGMLNEYSANLPRISRYILEF